MCLTKSTHRKLLLESVIVAKPVPFIVLETSVMCTEVVVCKFVVYYFVELIDNDTKGCVFFVELDRFCILLDVCR